MSYAAGFLVDRQGERVGVELPDMGIAINAAEARRTRL